MIADFFGAVGDVLSSEAVYSNAVVFAAVLAFGAVGEWVAERSGTLNISIEGMLLGGAFAAAMGFDLSDSVIVGALFGIAAGMIVAGVQAEMSHRLPADQFVVGLTLNILVLGMVGFLDSEWSPATRLSGRVAIPGLADIPGIGPALFDKPWLFYTLYALIPVAAWLVYRTRWGLEVRAAGENPQSADVSGVNVNKRRRQAIYFAGMTSGLGGAYLILGEVGRFTDGIVGGRGFIAIAAVIFGGWTLRGTVAGCLLFGSVLSFRLSLPVLGYELNSELLQALPFVVTILAMTLFARRVRPPAALARPFIRGLK